MTSKLIQISGRKRSGKDTTALMLKELLEERGKSVEIINFADPLKDIISTILGISIEEVNFYKDNPSNFKLQIADNNDGTIEHSTNLRSVLQLFGTEAMKKYFGENVWVTLLQDTIDKSDADYVIIPDTRFLCEIVPSATTIRVNSNKAVNVDTHRSETELDDYRFDITVVNDDYSLTKTDLKPVLNRLLNTKEITRQSTYEYIFRITKYNLLKVGIEEDIANRKANIHAVRTTENVYQEALKDAE